MAIETQNQLSELTDTQINRAAVLIAANLDDEQKQVNALVVDGFSVGQAHRLSAFLTIAFGRAILERMADLCFVDTISVVNDQAQSFEALLSQQPEFVATLKFAREHCAIGKLSSDIFNILVLSSPEIDAVSKALNSGVDISGASVTAALVGPIHAEHVKLTPLSHISVKTP